jgi:hypothetical protein
MDFLTPSFVIYISKHHHHQVVQHILKQTELDNITKNNNQELVMLQLAYEVSLSNTVVASELNSNQVIHINICV